MLWRHAVVIVGVLAFLARAAHAQEGFNGICASAFADKAITLAQRYVREFDVKWLRGEANEPLLGSGDIQSLADPGNAHQAVRAMSIVPVT